VLGVDNDRDREDQGDPEGPLEHLLVVPGMPASVRTMAPWVIVVARMFSVGNRVVGVNRPGVKTFVRVLHRPARVRSDIRIVLGRTVRVSPALDIDAVYVVG
jgi:hypothetical protein